MKCAPWTTHQASPQVSLQFATLSNVLDETDAPSTDEMEGFLQEAKAAVEFFDTQYSRDRMEKIKAITANIKD